MTYHTLLIRQVDGRWQAETSSYFRAMLTSRVASIRKAGFPYSSIIERWQWQIITTDGRQDSITHRVRLLNRYYAESIRLVAEAGAGT